MPYPLRIEQHTWLVAILLGSLLNASLFALLPQLRRGEPPPPPPVITLDFMHWQVPTKEKPKAAPPKPQPPRPKPKPQPVKPEPKKNTPPKPIKAPVLTDALEQTAAETVPPTISESSEDYEPLPEPVPLFQITSMPRFVHRETPAYPQAMRAQGKEATVKLEVLIDAKGKVRQVTVTQSAGPAFDQAAVSAIRASTFLPGNVDGKPVTVLMRMPVRFSLR